MEEELMDAADTGRYLKIDKQTVRRLAREGRIPCRKIGGSWRFSREAIDKWSSTNTLLQKHIMVIDDEAGVRNLLRRILEGEGYAVSTADGGEQAIEFLKGNTPDLIFLDLKMPDMNGPQVLREIRIGNGDIPVVILTAYPESALMFEALKYSPFVLLSKPIAPMKLINTIHNIFHQRAG